MNLNWSAFISVSQIERKIMKYFKSMAIIVDAFSDFFFFLLYAPLTLKLYNDHSCFSLIIPSFPSCL